VWVNEIVRNSVSRETSQPGATKYNEPTSRGCQRVCKFKTARRMKQRGIGAKQNRLAAKSQQALNSADH
jgi:hypothetical protein